MDELKQIKSVLLGLGIQVDSMEFTTSPTGSIDQASQVRTVDQVIDSITVVLTFQGQTITRKYTIEQLRSFLITGPGSGPAARPERDRKPNGLVSRIICRRRRV